MIVGAMKDENRKMMNLEVVSLTSKLEQKKYRFFFVQSRFECA